MANGVERSRRSWPNCCTRRSALQLPAQRLVPGVGIRCACGPLGYQGSKAAMKLIAQADVVLALGTRLGPFGTLPQHGLDYWPQDAKIIQIDADAKMLGLVEDRSRSASRRCAARPRLALSTRLKGKTLACQQNRDRARRHDPGGEGRLGEGAATSGRTKPTSIRWRSARVQQLHAPAPDAARAREGDAQARDGLHRHRQHLLGQQQLPALRGAALDVRRDELRQLRLRLPGDLRRQGGAPGSAGDRLCRRRRLGHQLQRAADLRAREDRRHRVLFNNGQWGAEKKNHVDFYSNRYPGRGTGEPELGRRCQGRSAARALRSTSSPTSALRCAQSVKNQADGKTTVLELMVTKELGDPFRRDALSRPVRLLEKYKNYV